MLDCKTFSRGNARSSSEGSSSELEMDWWDWEKTQIFLALRALRACEARVRSVPRNKEQDLNLDQLLTERNSYDYTTIATCHNLTPAS